ncbi:MAG: type II toxin-antitoxin system VapB family antitoxin [Gemmatimonadota bacterium]
MRTTLDIDDELVTEAKARAAREGRTLTSLIEDGLRLVLRERNGTDPEYDFRFPTVRGERPPSVDVADRDRLYDVMEGIGSSDRR